MLSFSTDDLRPQDRFDHWCEARARTLFGVTIEMPRERRPDFHGRFAARYAGGGATVFDMSASSYLLKRTPADIARVSSDSLCIVRQVRGPGTLDVGRGRIQHVNEAGLVVSHADLPFVATPHRSDGFDVRTIKVCLTQDLLLGARAYDLVPALAVPGTAFAGPLAALFDAVTAPARETDAGDAIAHLVRLALLVRGRLPPGAPESRAAVRAGVLQAARAILRRDLDDFELTPERVACELAISLRQLHVVFEPTGLSVARTLAALRVEAARRALTDDPTRAVAQIAFSCGFESLATFHRVFRKACGMTPGDLRASLAAERDPAATSAPAV